MGSNVIFFGWNRPIPGRERLSSEHFTDFVQYLGGLQQKGAIQSFDVVFLNAHGGDMNGFFLIRGESGKLADLVGSADWQTHMTRAMLHLEGSGAVLGATGDAAMERMKLWRSLLPV
jgi:hypothetical protein